jgi:dTDP-4-dehydrorhamnose reductase
MKILLIGKNGQVGFQLQRSLACLGQLISTDRHSLDISDHTAIETTIKEIKPDIIVNAAAYTDVDKAESEKKLAYEINANAPLVMAEQANKFGAALIHYSTDYVFNGQGSTPWSEADETDPVNYYGESKRAGERFIQDSGCNHLIFRTSWVYDKRGQNFLNTMLRLADQQDELSIVNDQIGAPTLSWHIADVTSQVIAQSKMKEDFWQNNTGLYHLVSSGETSWLGFAEAIFEAMHGQGMKMPKLKPISSSEYPTLAKRPANSRLSSEKIKRHFNVEMPHWRDSLGLLLSNN